MKNRKFFDEITDRTGTHSIKWDRVKEGGLAMWIADMDFRTPQAVTDSIIKRAEHTGRVVLCISEMVERQI